MATNGISVAELLRWTEEILTLAKVLTAKSIMLSHQLYNLLLSSKEYVNITQVFLWLFPVLTLSFAVRSPSSRVR